MVSLKEVEFQMLKEFMDKLDSEEKEAINLFKQKCPPLVFNDADRRKYNLIIISFMEGYRLGKRHGMEEKTTKKDVG